LQIKNQNIIGHSDITAYNARHVNPGIFFDWKSLAVDGHGLFPNCDISSIIPDALYSYGDVDGKIATLQSNLNAYGYKIDLTGVFDEQTRNVVRAFNMHFHNDVNYDGFEYESWDTISDARLDDLLQQIAT
jgi:N-acetyl-anhydromuramyl-L-alanine amidase AmpD